MLLAVSEEPSPCGTTNHYFSHISDYLFRFLNSGARVALIGTDLEDLINTGKQFPKQALVIKCDLSADDQPYDMFNTVMHEFNGIDILVNAAGNLGLKEG